MGSIKRQLERKRRKMSKELFELPLVKETDMVTVFDQKRMEDIQIPVVSRDDGSVFINILSQVDYNNSEYRKLRKRAAKMMKKIRTFNFAHSEEKSFFISVSITADQLEHLYDIIVKDTPKDIKFQGVNMVESITEFEEWYDEIKRKENEEKKEQETLPEEEVVNEEETP